MTALREFLIFAAVLVGFAGVLTLIISIYALALFSVVVFFGGYDMNGFSIYTR